MPDTFFDRANDHWQQYTLPWLAQLDAGHHAGCWHTAAASLQQAITLADWQAALQALPPRQLRQLLACQHYRQPPAAAPCWVYQCISGNDEHAHRQETLTLQQQADGSWQVAGYFVHSADEQQG
ncbi:DUF4019 domain-containing protein [Vogesella mureinivorans]|uniref:DUF4019 domain-containing protein n=1 Tax=Vogesella mureinivorans TaxID=657276 RepID=UPI0011C810BA|nr:DUF4019 domain-containing protein [Vogesella mureinivorans]